MEIKGIPRSKRAQILRIAAANGATDVRVFGSLARGDAKAGSDVDLLVKLERGRSLLDIVALKQDLEDLLGCKVDVVTERSISPLVRDEILKEAVYL